MPAPLPSFVVLVLGGYGNFGRIICQRLSAIAGIELIVAGRDAIQCADLARSLGARGVCLDMDQDDLSAQLRQLKVQLVISTAGPFQRQDYRVAQAALAADAHYLDLADARHFVCGIHQLHQQALDRGLLISSGASSVPALAAAVIDQARPQFSRLDAIHHGISSSEKTPGVATVAAVLDYCGKPIRQWRERQWIQVHGWQEMVSHDFPAPLGRRWLANCDIPDLELFPQRYPEIASVRFSAGIGLKMTQWGTWLLSWLARAGLVRKASVLAPFLRACAVRLEPFGDGLSGMFVQLDGLDTSGHPLRWTWHLIAQRNHGPNIPCMAAVALARKLASGKLQIRGAMPCMGLLTLEEYLAELDGLDIQISQQSSQRPWNI